MDEDEELEEHLQKEDMGGQGYGGGPREGGARLRVFRGRDGKLHLQPAKGTVVKGKPRRGSESGGRRRKSEGDVMTSRKMGGDSMVDEEEEEA